VGEEPAIEQLRQANASWSARRRRAWPVALVALAIVVDLSATKSPHVGVHGQSLGLTTALAGFIIGLIGARHALFIRSLTWRWWVPCLTLLLASSAILVWLQPSSGLGQIGFLGGLSLVVMSRALPNWMGVAALVGICLAALLVAALTGKEVDHSRWLGMVTTVLPFVLYAFFVTMFWWNRQHQHEVEDLLVKLEQSRDAELRAVALAERQRLARDMHDVLAHTLSGLTLQLEGVRLLASSGGDVRVAAAVDRAHQLAKNGLAEARQAIGMLRGDELPGPDRLEGLADAFAADTGIPCRFSTRGAALELRPEVRLALYRVTQEALTNIRKHAHPDRVCVTLEYLTADAGPAIVGLAIQDFGVAPLEVPHLGPGHSCGYGLAGMRERAELLGGSLTAGPTGDGFRVELRVAA
jgi:signal transduction histidine kinase